MFPNWLGVTCAILAVVAFFVVYPRARNIALPKRLLYTLIALVVAVPAASFSIYYAHLTSVPSWYYQFRSISGTELLVVALGVAGAMVAACLPHVIRGVVLVGVIAFSVVPFLKPFIGPFKDGDLGNSWKGEVCMQSTGSTCGAASLATVLKHYGVDVEEPDLAREAHSYRRGTESWYLARAARSRDLDVTFKHYDELPKGLQLPAIAGVKLGGVGHFIPIIKRERHYIVVGDPLHGRKTYTYAELKRKYKFTGFFMLIRK